MFYKPNFCCHCGEKIVRPRWTPLTSRRFCDFCSVEQKQHDLIPRAAAVALILFGFAGLTAYLGTGDSNPKPGALPNAKLHASKSPDGKPISNLHPSNQAAPGSITTNPDDASPPANSASGKSKQRDPERNSSTEAVYYCGAMTKKGTACTRRVKIPGRCWQHLGQSAISTSKDRVRDL